jgi:phosphate transport system permease protein
MSIAIIIGIVVILARESADFFAHVSLAEFLGSTHWTPIIGEPKSYGVWPLLSATFTTAAIAMVVAVPLGLLAAIYLSEYAAPRTRRSSSRPSSFWRACRPSCSATSRSRC